MGCGCLVDTICWAHLGELRHAMPGNCPCMRRRLLLASLAGVVAALALLGGAFRLSEAHSPPLISAGPLRGSCPIAGPQTCSACLMQARACCSTSRSFWCGCCQCCK